MVCDFNRDGYQDIFFFCHRKDGSFDEVGKYGDHHTNSILYWGSGDGYSETNVDKLPSVGAHYDMGVDVGEIAKVFTQKQRKVVFNGVMCEKFCWC